VTAALEELQRQRADLQSRADEQIASRLEPVIQEGQSLERTLQDQSGKAVKKAVVFGNTGIVIAEAGETITAQHISKVQRVVKERLEEIEGEFKKDLERELDQIDMTKQQVRAEAEEQMEGLRNQLEDQSSESQSQNSHLRDELQELRAFTFLSESRYRELKQRGAGISGPIRALKLSKMCSAVLLWTACLKSCGPRFATPRASRSAESPNRLKVVNPSAVLETAPKG
jgi:DNA-directed RNA polymerase subunit beta'